ncbi:MAG: PEP-CTERM sorting domain-containing protein [Planctomycetaceae bacterium]|nr:PEP-CTERM sorting domain-containing protein [Planctomycetaceae bacterium]
MYNHLRSFTLALAVVLFACHSSSGDLIFSENFGNIGDGTNITTSNTSFDYRRIGSGGGAIVSTNPSSFTQAAMSLGGASGGSLNGVGLSSGLGSKDFVGLSFNFRSANVSQGDLVITTGSGANFSNNSGFSTSQLFFGIQFDAGNVEYRRSSGWTNAGFSLSNNTDYKIEIYGNNTGADVDYGSGLVANQRLDILINGTNIADDVSFNNNQLADGFRIYQVNGGQTYEIDDITLVDGNFSSVPEPTSLLMFGATALIGLQRRRKNSRA